jgi:hypothetical protein
MLLTILVGKMHIDQLDIGKLSKLTHEQLKTVDRWIGETKTRAELISAMEVAKDMEELNKLAKQIVDTDAEYCEHGRHKYGTCMFCSEIEEILFPELREEL